MLILSVCRRGFRGA